MVAVLPFDNLSSNPDQGYFSDGITEDIITDLSKFQEIVVVARNSSFAFGAGRVIFVLLVNISGPTISSREASASWPARPYQRAADRSDNRLA